jgi:hypothetical protein
MADLKIDIETGDYEAADLTQYKVTHSGPLKIRIYLSDYRLLLERSYVLACNLR